MKKLIAFLAAAAMATTLAACGRETAAETLPETTVQATAPATSATEPATLPDDLPLIEDTEPAEVDGFADNFSVDSASAEAYARQIQAVVADQNLEALAAMAAYPMYIGFSDGGVSVDDAQALMDLGADRIFTAELAASIEGARTAGLSPSRAGFSLSKDGVPNIIFGVRDGALAIEGINY